MAPPALHDGAHRGVVAHATFSARRVLQQQAHALAAGHAVRAIDKVDDHRAPTDVQWRRVCSRALGVAADGQRLRGPNSKSNLAQAKQIVDHRIAMLRDPARAERLPGVRGWQSSRGRRAGAEGRRSDSSPLERCHHAGIRRRPLFDRLRATRPRLRVLYMSGYADDAVVRRGMIREGMPFLQKPFTPGTLGTKVREVLDAEAND
jgi:hypothetical protein